MLKGLVKKLFGSQPEVQIADSPFEPIRTSKREGVLNIEEVEDRVGGGNVTGYYHFIRIERAQGKVLEINDKKMLYGRSYKPDEQIKGIRLKIDDEGITGEIDLPVDFPSRLDRKAMLGQKISYNHKSDRLCERCLGGDNRSHKYSLIVLTGQLSGEKYSSEQSEVC